VSATPQSWLEELITWATTLPGAQDDLVGAKREFFARTGEVFDDDRRLEMRMSAFLEHYACDRTAPHLGATPAQARYRAALSGEAPEVAMAWRAFTETVHGLFEVRRLRPGLVGLSRLADLQHYEVTERRQLVGLKAGDVLECRVIPFAGDLFFSGAWCFHPHEVAKLIRAQVKRLQRESTYDDVSFAADCAQRALKVERYRQIAVTRIYDFDGRKV
jgi:hypothetical protein